MVTSVASIGTVVGWSASGGATDSAAPDAGPTGDAGAIDESAACERRCHAVRERSKQRLDLDGRLGAGGSGGEWREERDAHDAYGGQRGDAPQQVRQ